MDKMNTPTGAYILHYFDAAKNWPVTPRIVPDEWEWLELITDGVVFLEQPDGSLKKYGRGTLFWHIGGDNTVYRTTDAEPFKTMVIKMFVPEVRRVIPRVTVFHDESLLLRVENEIGRYIEDETLNGDYCALFLYNLLFYEAYLVHHCHRSSLNPEPLDRAIRMIRRSYQEPLSIRQIAKTAGVSESYLYSLFREYLGVSPHRYLLNFRLRLASHLLVTTNTSIKKVAESCGFDQLNYFYRVFTAAFGMPPLRYRNNFHAR